MELSEKAYSKQVLKYIEKGEYKEALTLAKEMYEKFHTTYNSKLILSKAYFWNREYEKAAELAKECITLAKNEDDMFIALMLTSSAYIGLSKFREAYELLSRVPKSRITGEYLEMKILLEIIMHKDVLPDFEALHKINKKAAEKLLTFLINIE